MNNKNPRYRFQKAWSWPGDVEAFIMKHVESPCLHACCGESRVGDIQLDLVHIPDRPVAEFVQADIFNPPFPPKSFQTIVIDPPWHLPYHLRPRLMFTLRDLLRPGGKLIFNAPWWFNIPNLPIEEVWYAVPRAWRNCPLIIIARRISDLENFQTIENKHVIHKSERAPHLYGIPSH